MVTLGGRYVNPASFSRKGDVSHQGVGIRGTEAHFDQPPPSMTAFATPQRSTVRPDGNTSCDLGRIWTISAVRGEKGHAELSEGCLHVPRFFVGQVSARLFLQHPEHIDVMLCRIKMHL